MDPQAEERRTFRVSKDDAIIAWARSHTPFELLDCEGRFGSGTRACLSRMVRQGRLTRIRPGHYAVTRPVKP